MRVFPFRLVLHVEVTADRPGRDEEPPAVDQAVPADTEVSRHEGPPELGLTPRR